MQRSIARLTAVLLAAGLVAACKGSSTSTSNAALKVSDITVGRSLNTDKTIAEKTDSFRSPDIFYVSVKTEGSAPNASLVARWTYENGQPVSESTQNIAPTGVAVTEFHAEKPDGWPAGAYKVEVLLNGVSAGSRKFTVE